MEFELKTAREEIERHPMDQNLVAYSALGSTVPDTLCGRYEKGLRENMHGLASVPKHDMNTPLPQRFFFFYTCPPVAHGSPFQAPVVGRSFE